MLFAAAVSALSLASLVSAQTVIPVQVGSTQNAQGGVFQFIPNNITAKEGDVVSFQFSGIPGNHSVTQSAFVNPCNPVTGGFDSGNVFLNVSQATTPTFNVTITNGTQPIWFFCKQLAPAPHCGKGMVGSINAPTSGNTFDKFQANAMANGTDPTKVGQFQGGLVGIGASASAPVQSQSAITIFTGPPNPSATAPAAGGSNNTSSAGGNGTAPGTAKPASAADLGVSSVMVVLSAVLGAFML